MRSIVEINFNLIDLITFEFNTFSTYKVWGNVKLNTCTSWIYLFSHNYLSGFAAFSLSPFSFILKKNNKLLISPLSPLGHIQLQP